MFKIFAIIVITMAGKPVGEPIKAAHKQTFASEAECKAFERSKESVAELKALKEALEARLQPKMKAVITTSCAKAEDDGSI